MAAVSPARLLQTILFLGNHINKLNSANTAVGIKLSSVKNVRPAVWHRGSRLTCLLYKIAEFKSRSGEPFMKLLTKVIESNCPSSLQLFSNQDIVSKLNEGRRSDLTGALRCFFPRYPRSKRAACRHC